MPWNDVDGLAFIMLVNGVFGFDKKRVGGLSYVASGKKENERILLLDLGSSSNVYNNMHGLFCYLKGGQVDYGVQDSKVLAFTSSEPWKEEVITITFRILIVCNPGFKPLVILNYIFV